MDVYCTTCGEPWDHFHLWQDAIHETGLSDQDIETWLKLPSNGRLTPYYRSAFTSAGYTFGKTMMNVTRCPACPPEATPDADKLQAKQLIEDMLGDDHDVIVATFNDHRL